MSQRKYLNFTTPYGVELSSIAKSGLSSFLIHESGYHPKLTGWNHEAVDSPFWRFYYNPKPGSHLRFQGRTIPLEPDSLVMIPAFTVFDCCGPKPVSHFWIHFTLTRQSHIKLEAPFVIAVDQVLKPLLAEAISLHGQSGSNIRAQQLYHTSAALLHLGFGKMESQPSPIMPEPLAEILSLIHHAPHADLSNAFLAKRSGFSLEKFIRWFREHLDITPASYVSQMRIKMASEALALTDKSIDQIASEYGFPNRFYFSRVFANELGCGPAEFRRRQRDKKGL